MTDRQPFRITEVEEVVEDGRTTRRARVTEYATAPPAEHQELAGSPAVPPGYDPKRDSPAATGALRLVGSAPARRALLPGSPAPDRHWWRFW